MSKMPRNLSSYSQLRNKLKTSLQVYPHTPPKRRGEKKTIGMHARLLYKLRPAKEMENLV